MVVRSFTGELDDDLRESVRQCIIDTVCDDGNCMIDFLDVDEELADSVSELVYQFSDIDLEEALEDYTMYGLEDLFNELHDVY